jgi:hypothetical protein
MPPKSRPDHGLGPGNQTPRHDPPLSLPSIARQYSPTELVGSPASPSPLPIETVSVPFPLGLRYVTPENRPTTSTVASQTRAFQATERETRTADNTPVASPRRTVNRRIPPTPLQSPLPEFSHLQNMKYKSKVQKSIRESRTFITNLVRRLPNDPSEEMIHEGIIEELERVVRPILKLANELNRRSRGSAFQICSQSI